MFQFSLKNMSYTTCTYSIIITILILILIALSIHILIGIHDKINLVCTTLYYRVCFIFDR